MARAYSEDLRERIRKAWQEGAGTRAQIAARFGVSVSCVRDLIRRVKETGRAAAKAHGGGARRKADTRQDQLLAGLAAARSDDTLEEYRVALAATPGGAKLSGPTISRMLARLRLTQKKKTLHADERQSERVQALRAAWPARLAGVAARDLIFIDESGCNRAMTRTRARSLAGTRAFATAPRNWGDNVSIISAPGINGPLATLHLPGAVNGEAFLLYVKDVLIPKLWPGAVVVLDNLGAHRLKAVREQIEAAGARLEYLPPYSPDFNPIELAWSKLMNHLRKVAARTSEALYDAIADGLQTLSASNAQGWFGHCGYLG